MVLAIRSSPKISRYFPKNVVFLPKTIFGKNWGKFGKSKERMSGMRKVNYKGRCTKRKLSKCKDVCRTFDVIQLKAAEILQANDDIKAFRCNVCLEGVENNQYMSDLVAEKSDGSIMVLECVWRNNLSKPLTVHLLDISRNYWMSKNVEDWGIVIEKEDSR